MNSVNIAVRHRGSNGIVERTNAQMLSNLRTHIRENQSDWGAHVAFAQIAINDSYNKSIGDNPHHLLYGYTKYYQGAYRIIFPQSKTQSVCQIRTLHEKDGRNMVESTGLITKCYR